MKRSCDVVLTSLAVLALCAVSLVPRVASARSSRVTASHRYLVLIAGICPVFVVLGPGCGSPSERLSPQQRTNGFDPVQSALRDAGAHPTPVYFSYFIRKGWQNPTYYYAKDTHEHVEVAAYQLETQLRAVVSHDPQATFDLLAHSLGGVVASYWVVKHADALMLRKIHSLVTFDSPLRGISSILAIEGLYGAGRVWFDLLPSSPVIRAIDDSQHGVLAKLPGRVHTVSDKRDKIVTSNDSWLGRIDDQSTNKFISYCPFRWDDVLDKVWCHGASLRNDSAVAWAAHWLK